MICASDLIGCELHTESGEHLGAVHDLRAEWIDEHWRLVGLVVGRRGMSVRLAGTGAEPFLDRDVIEWQAIMALRDGLLIVRDGTAPVRA